MQGDKKPKCFVYLHFLFLKNIFLKISLPNDHITCYNIYAVIRGPDIFC